jgi:hypothetical protein
LATLRTFGLFHPGKAIIEKKKLWSLGGMGELEKQSTGEWQYGRERREKEIEMGRECWISLL